MIWLPDKNDLILLVSANVLCYTVAIMMQHIHVDLEL